LVVAVAGGTAVCFVVDRGRRATERIDLPYGLRESVDPPRSPHELGEMVNSLQEPVVPTQVPSDIRGVERSRRARRPADPKNVADGLAYDSVFEGRSHEGTRPRAKPAEPMPPTSCRSVEPAPRHAANVSGPYHVHDLAVSEFENAAGFGRIRMAIFRNDRGVMVASPAIDRVELVSLLTDSEPSAYVLDEMATPPLARQAARRPLDEFERRALDAVRRGEHLVWTREAPTRMFGAIRARAHCLDCHADAKKGDLLGGLTYYLDTSVDRLRMRANSE